MHYKKIWVTQAKHPSGKGGYLADAPYLASETDVEEYFSAVLDEVSADGTKYPDGLFRGVKNDMGEILEPPDPGVPENEAFKGVKDHRLNGKSSGDNWLRFLNAALSLDARGVKGEGAMNSIAMAWWAEHDLEAFLLYAAKGANDAKGAKADLTKVIKDNGRRIREWHYAKNNVQ